MYFDGIWVNIFHIYQPPNWSKKIIDRVVKESYLPFTKFLLANKAIFITLNITGALTEQLKKYQHTNVLKNIKTLADRGQVELMTTGAWHPIFPLITKKFQDVSLKANEKINKSLFAKNSPKGCWLPELAYAPAVEPVLKKHGIQWIVVDETATAVKHSSKALPAWKTNKGLSVLFRDPEASAYFFTPLKKRSGNAIHNHLKRRNAAYPLITATDGENLGHHNPQMLNAWTKMVLRKNVKTMTVSQLLLLIAQKKTIQLRKASWADTTNSISAHNPYILWNDKKNPLHNQQWRLSRLAMRRAEKNGVRAILSLSKMLYSDQYWWASNAPWWDKNVVIKGAKKMLTFMKKEGTKKELNDAKKYTNAIITMANRHTALKSKKRKTILFGGERH